MFVPLARSLSMAMLVVGVLAAPLAFCFSAVWCMLALYLSAVHAVGVLTAPGFCCVFVRGACLRFVFLSFSQYREIMQDEFLPEVTSSEKVIVHFYHKDFQR